MSLEASDAISMSTWPFTKQAFVWAMGPAGVQVANILADLSIPVVVFQSGTHALPAQEEGRSEARQGVRSVQGERILRIDGHFGQFRIWIVRAEGDVSVCEAGCILIHGSDPSLGTRVRGVAVPESNITTVEELEALARSEGSEEVPDSLGIWLDPDEGLPDRASAARALEAVLHLRRKGELECCVLFRHIPLWGLNGQSLYDDLREKSVRFLRLGMDRPDLTVRAGKVELEVHDQTVSDRPVSLSFDKLVLVRQPSPLPGSGEVAQLVGDPLDTEGFLQKDNVHLYPANSFRKGIYYLGPCKGEQAAEEVTEEVGAILPELLAPMASGTLEAPERIRIDRGHCVACLTCYRVCPHHALDISRGPVPVPVDPACYGCGMCAALCPGNAIELVQRPGEQILGELDKVGGGEEGLPLMTVFCCSRSGSGPAGIVEGNDLSPSPRASVIEVPCACSVSEEMLLAAFLKGATKVVVVGCHPENCVSQRGPAVGKKRTQRVTSYLAGSGQAMGEFVRFVAIAPNEAHRLARILNDLEDDPSEPSRGPAPASS